MVTTRSCKRTWRNNDIYHTEKQQQQLTAYGKQIKRPRAISKKDESQCCSLHPVKLSESLLAASQYFSLSYEPSQVIGREHFISSISQKLKKWFYHEDNLSLYLCGSPGTGKSLCVKTALDIIATEYNKNTVDGLPKIHTVYVNCASISDPKMVYSVILSQLDVREEYSRDATTNFSRVLENVKQPVLIVLEELDFLVTRDMSVISLLLECPHSLQTVGILATANSVDLVDRTLPSLKIYQTQPETIPFRPYVCEEIEKILYQRFILAQDCYPCLKRIPQSQFLTAFKLVAKKISSSSGDIRLALDVIRMLFLSAAKTSPGEYQKIDSLLLQHAARILEEKGGSASMKRRITSLPFQQQLVVLACFILSNRQSPFTLGELYSQLTQLSCQLDLPALSFSQFVDICEASLTAHGIIQLEGKKMDKRRQRCSLLTCANEIKAALEPFAVYASFL